MILNILFIWAGCYILARLANFAEERSKPSPEEERQRRLDELYGRW